MHQVPQNRLFSQRVYTGDAVMFVDEHYVGHDGFVVPKDFPEFFVRFPHHIRRWVRRHAEKSASREDIEDWTQDLCAHMSSLPSTSKHREAGRQDVIQTFDPFRHHGANLARFLNYVNHCLANKFRTIHSARIKSPLCRAKRCCRLRLAKRRPPMTRFVNLSQSSCEWLPCAPTNRCKTDCSLGNLSILCAEEARGFFPR